MDVSVKNLKTTGETALAALFAPSGAAASKALRQRAFDLFQTMGLPSRRLESWHYTDLKRMLANVAPRAATSAAANVDAEAGACVIRFVDGHCIGHSALPKGVTLRGLSDVLAQGDADTLGALYASVGSEDPVVALNAALADDGVVIDVAAGVTLDAAIILDFVSSDATARSEFMRCLVRVGAGAKLTLVERHVSAQASAQRHLALAVSVGTDASVSHVFEGVADLDVLLASLLVDVAAQGNFQSFALVSGGRLTRRQIWVRAGQATQVGLRGVSLLRGEQHADTTLVIDHVEPNSESRELFKHILDGSATGVFQGKVVVQPNAQKTDGGMKSHALILSDDATMDNKPELEIYADDVVCGHGATVAQLDDDQLFYLMSRGIPKTQAQAMLIEAFALSAVDFVEDEVQREQVMTFVRDWMMARGA